MLCLGNINNDPVKKKMVLNYISSNSNIENWVNLI